MSDHTAIDLRGLKLTEALRRAADFLEKGGAENPKTDARMLLLAATGHDRTALIRDPDQELAPPQADRLAGFLLRRMAGEPITRIAGSRGFWTLNLLVTPDVLDPRPDSEAIVEAALAELGTRRKQSLRILDLGTGTGALLLALLAECPQATGLGIDLSPAACAVARANLDRNGLSRRGEVRQGRWADGLDEDFDVIVSNPPYIETATIPTLAVEVRNHDPHLALDGGPDGLDAYREIIPAVARLLRPDGVAVLELGEGQAPAAAALAKQAGLEVGGLRKDLGGIERALVLRRAPTRY